MTRGVFVLIAVGVTLLALWWFGIVCAKVNAEYASSCPRQVAGGNRSALTGADCIVGGCGVTRTMGSSRKHDASGIGMDRTSAVGSPGQPPISSDENRTGRAAEREVPSAASARRLPRGADAKLAQARPVCLFDAIRQVESSGDDRAVGDGGRSLGPYQCGRAAWADGGGNPADYDRLVWNRAACERVMLGYWKRYRAVTDEQKARTWNGGPRGAQKKATLKYWHRVKEEMQ